MDRQLHIPPSCFPFPHSIILHSSLPSACCHALLRSTCLYFTLHLFRGRYPCYDIATAVLYRRKVGAPLSLCQPPPCRLLAVACIWADALQRRNLRRGLSSAYAGSVVATRRPCSDRGSTVSPLTSGGSPTNMRLHILDAIPCLTHPHPSASPTIRPSPSTTVDRQSLNHAYILG
ncbi:hypothetical protein SCHPADRAFT_594801 [Schizopora paradoxa]|uniref:Uncharacterized protein n=1 Tax=Schizopora paradoxa TaxID=27342 RepID=A0A0H2RAB8_9AGAM|nr:hypothetical protein SCHPADRAFT_594801 [Schizopora paradoxa]